MVVTEAMGVAKIAGCFIKYPPQIPAFVFGYC
jgi:hypothetical protein